MWVAGATAFSSDCIYLTLQAMTPKPIAGEVIELNVSILDERTGLPPKDTATAATVQMYDSIVCGTTYQGDSTLNSYTWESRDLYGTAAQMPSAITGSYTNSYTKFLDSSASGPI